MCNRLLLTFVLCGSVMSPGLASALSNGVVATAYVQASGNSYQIDPLRSSYGAQSFQVSTQLIYANYYKAHVDFWPSASYGWTANEIGIRVNTIGPNNTRCSFRNQSVTAAPIHVAFDVYCVRPVAATQWWEYTTSDFQIALFNGGTQSSFAIVDPYGTIAPGSPFLYAGWGLDTQQNSTGYYMITAYANSTYVPNIANANIHVQATGTVGVMCEAQSPQTYIFTPPTLNRLVFYVSCFNASGQAVNSAFRVETNFDTLPNDPSGRYLTTSDPVTGGVSTQYPVTPSAQVTRCTDSNGNPITGCWTVTQNAGNWISAASFVTAMRRTHEQEDLPNSNYCKVDTRISFNDPIRVRCYHWNGDPVDATFGVINEIPTYAR